MQIQTEPIGSIPRPAELVQGLKAFAAGDIGSAELELLSRQALQDTIKMNIPVSQLGTTDDCGFSPFADDVSTSREIAFAKIRARIEGTQLAERSLGKKQMAV